MLSGVGIILNKELKETYESDKCLEIIPNMNIACMFIIFGLSILIWSVAIINWIGELLLKSIQKAGPSSLQRCEEAVFENTKHFNLAYISLSLCNSTKLGVISSFQPIK